MRKTLSTLAILLFCSFAIAQNTGIKDLRFNRLSVVNGMPGLYISAFIQDAAGYMWIAGMNGLVRYDGYNPKVYTLSITDPSFSVSSVYEDRSGKLWAGTGYKGLYYYDRGSDTFYRYKMPVQDSLTLADDYITAIRDDQWGDLWLVVANEKNNKLFRLDKKTGTITHFSNTEKGKGFISTGQINDVIEDKSGTIWFGSDNGFYGYSRKEARFVAHFTNTDSSARQRVQYFCEDAQQPGTFWFYTSLAKTGLPTGLWRWNAASNTIQKFSHTKAAGSIASDSVLFIKNDSGGRLWVSTARGLSLFDKGIFYNYFPPNENKDWGNPVSQWVEDDKNNFWCRAGLYTGTPYSTGLYGMYYFDTKSKAFTLYRYNEKDDESVTFTPNKLLTDNCKNLWYIAGSQYVGLQWINRERSRFAWYQDNPSMISHNYTGGQIVDFAEAPDGVVWMATSNHFIYRWLPGTDSFQHIEPAAYKGKNVYASALRVDKEGMVWCGVYIEGMGFQGLDCYNPKTGQLTHYKHHDNDSSSLKNNYVYVLCIDHNNNVWAGTDDGTVCLFNRKTHSFTRYPLMIGGNEKRFVRYRTVESLVYYIYEDKNYNIWAGDNRGGLCRLNRHTNQFEAYPGIIANSEVLQFIYQDSRNRLWVSTIATGVYCYDPAANHTRRYTTKDGLLFSGATGIEEDRNGNIWLSCSQGISILNPATGTVRTLTGKKALPDDFFTFSFRTSNGTYLLSGRKGFIALNPDDYVPDTNAPVVHIETVNFTNPSASVAEQKDSSIAKWGKKQIHLSYDNNKITFSYVGIHYQNAAATTYAYRLDNYDKQWIEAGTDRTATYTNLSPGTYTFRVKAANGDGVWSKTDDAVTIVIATPWWQTWWFYTLVAVAAFAVIYLIYRYQLAQALKIQQVRNNIARDLHDEIGSSLSTISIYSKVAQQHLNTPDTSPDNMLKKISENASQVMESMSDIVWSVNTKNDKFENLFSRMREHAVQLFEAKNYQLHFVFDENLNEIKLDMEQQKNFYLIYKEALNNIAKYANAKNAWIELTARQSYIVLSIKDDGEGFNVNALNANGYGLANMQNRAAALGGKLTNSSFLIQEVGKKRSIRDRLFLSCEKQKRRLKCFRTKLSESTV